MQSLFSVCGIHCSQYQKDLFEKFLVLFMKWNNTINLSSIREKKEIIIKHLIDSILGAQKCEFTSDKKNILDLGTGGGIPAIPLAILYPHLQIVAADSVQKKIHAIDDMIKKLELTNITTIAERAENLGQNLQYREQFDGVVTRAFAPWPVLLELSLPLIQKNGFLYAWQTPSLEKDITESPSIIQQLGGTLKNIETYALPEDSGKRIIVRVQKEKNTPKKFPRKVGIPKKRPLAPSVNHLP